MSNKKQFTDKEKEMAIALLGHIAEKNQWHIEKSVFNVTLQYDKKRNGFQQSGFIEASINELVNMFLILFFQDEEHYIAMKNAVDQYENFESLTGLYQ